MLGNKTSSYRLALFQSVCLIHPRGCDYLPRRSRKWCGYVLYSGKELVEHSICEDHSMQLVHLRQLRNCLQVDRQKDNNRMQEKKEKRKLGMHVFSKHEIVQNPAFEIM